MPVKSIVVGWDLDKIADQEESFEKGFTAVFSQANGKKPDFVTDPDHIRFVSEKEEIDHLVEQGLCDIIVCSETLSGDANIGFGTLKQWKAGGVQKIILILDDSKYAKGKVKSLYDNGFYDMLYVKDFKGRGLISLLLGGRNRDQAYEYYGLENYKDLFTEQEGKKDKNRNDSRDGKEAGAAKKEPGKKKSRKGDGGGTEVKEKRKAPEKEAVKTSEKRKRSKKEDKENKPDAEGTSFDNENVAAFLDKGVSLNSSKDIIKRQRAIGRTMYAIKKPKEADFSKDVTAFLKPGMEPLQYIRAMETATHVDLSDREKALNHKDAILEELLDYYTTKDNTWMNNLRQHLTDRPSWDAELRQRISTYGITSGISDGVQDEIFKEFNDFMFGYDFLGDLIRDPDVTDIKVLNYDSVLVKRKGKRVPEDRTFRSPEHYTAFISHLTKRNHVNIQNNAAVKFMDTKCFKEARLRVNIQTEYINCSGIPSLHIRKENNVKYSTDDLVSAGMMTYDTASYLIYKAREDTGILFVGGNGQGKTSLFNWLLDFIPYTATGQCLQESDELFSTTHIYSSCRLRMTRKRISQRVRANTILGGFRP